ncbi:FecR family protein [Novosphingobium sp. ES2-1]|uniref:FecR family protein n=1 Tax=Novosphingobium sp. ES2-1 TaxID=2780074 RepID=UPI00187FA8F3|nr:FecR domain-containing protein [Novosphingobium sp. ES2-1]QOV95906.1 FecR domain-containing protein [Novosphingobium sp. ES2-1]
MTSPVNSTRSSDEDFIAGQIARMDSGAWTATDEATLQTWLDEVPARRGLLLRMEAEWVALDPASAATDSKNEEPSAPLAISSAGRWTRRGLMGAAAASVVGGYLAFRLGDGATDFETRVGEIRRLPLADGSVMTMNSASQIKVNLAQDVRQIALLQGEAWFEVAKDAKRPFIVQVGDVQVRAVGTAFSVRTRGTAVEVLVTEGVVETSARHDSNLKLTLKGGDRAIVGASALVDFETGQSTDVDRALAWRSGMIDLNGTPLSSAAEEFNRYNRRQIVIADPAIAAEQFDGLFRVNDPDGFAEAVKASLGVRINTAEPGIIRIE